MDDSRPAQAAMYDRGSGDTLDLLFLQCGACGALTFPSNAYGCRACGAPREDGKTVRRPGLGRMLNALTVHQNLEPTLAAPYVVGEIELAEGIVEEAVLMVEDETAVPPGTLMRAVAAPHPKESGLYVCRFALAGDQTEDRT